MSILVICGVMIGYICSAVTEFVVAFAQDSNIVNLHNWSQGSFSGMTWGNVRAAALVVLPALAAAFCLSKPMAAYQMGRPTPGAWASMSKPFPGCWCCFPACWPPVSRPLRGPSPLWASRCPIWSSSCSAAQGRWWCCPVLPGRGRLLPAVRPHRPQHVCPTELSISAVTAVFGAPVVIWLLVRRGQEGVR